MAMTDPVGLLRPRSNRGHGDEFATCRGTMHSAYATMRPIRRRYDTMRWFKDVISDRDWNKMKLNSIASRNFTSPNFGEGGRGARCPGVVRRWGGFLGGPCMQRERGAASV